MEFHLKGLSFERACWVGSWATHPHPNLFSFFVCCDNGDILDQNVTVVSRGAYQRRGARMSSMSASAPARGGDQLVKTDKLDIRTRVNPRTRVTPRTRVAPCSLKPRSLKLCSQAATQPSNPEPAAKQS